MLVYLYLVFFFFFVLSTIWWREIKTFVVAAVSFVVCKVGKETNDFLLVLHLKATAIKSHANLSGVSLGVFTEQSPR